MNAEPSGTRRRWIRWGGLILVALVCGGIWLVSVWRTAIISTPLLGETRQIEFGVMRGSFGVEYYEDNFLRRARFKWIETLPPSRTSHVFGEFRGVYDPSTPAFLFFMVPLPCLFAALALVISLASNRFQLTLSRWFFWLTLASVLFLWYFVLHEPGGLGPSYD